MILGNSIFYLLKGDYTIPHVEKPPQVILVRIETSPDDIHGLHAAEGVLTPGFQFQGMSLR